MSKQRIYEYAKELNLKSKEIIDELKKHEYRGFKSYASFGR